MTLLANSGHLRNKTWQSLAFAVFGLTKATSTVTVVAYYNLGIPIPLEKYSHPGFPLTKCREEVALQRPNPTQSQSQMMAVSSQLPDLVVKIVFRLCKCISTKPTDRNSTGIEKQKLLLASDTGHFSMIKYESPASFFRERVSTCFVHKTLYFQTLNAG